MLGAGHNRDRQVAEVLDLQLAGAAVEADVVEVTAGGIQRRARGFGRRSTVAVMPGHLMFMRRGAVRTIVVGLHGHRAGRKREVQPDGREQPQGPLAHGLADRDAVYLANQFLTLADIPG